jgi:hypothetical protein
MYNILGVLYNVAPIKWMASHAIKHSKYKFEDTKEEIRSHYTRYKQGDKS